ncbi:MAG: acetyl CoA synthetase subunit alpha [Chlamydiae bacterium CG10_big_fil_rev_8_21_14_0_10_35_9]|nr:MAG: acetyl CoA synthetase subunit alpha [Chlamydiae bacterium CG10_big_fil_rev_8_21_14_0_10_35_9]
MSSSFDPSLNILHRKQQQLDHIFYPKTVAVVGASERKNSVGRTVLWNLLKSPFGGTIYPVNPKRANVLGIKAYKTLHDIPEKVDLVVIVIPAKFVASIIQDCVDLQIPAAVIISAGFKELGEPGIKLEEEILTLARQGNMRIIGPNCLGVMNPINGLNATFAADMAYEGNLAFLSQSGALCTAVLDWSLKNKVGFSSFVSVGSMIDVNWGDLIYYFGNDPNTKSILLYMESIGDPRSFLSAAKEVALNKPIILIKAGRTEESAKAAASHTGSLAGSDDVLDAALKRVGVLRVDTISDLFSMARVLSKQPRPKGPNLTIVTNAGGPGVIATDALIENGGSLSKLDEATYTSLNDLLPPQWSHNNPVDILGDADDELYAKTVEIVAKDKHTNGLLVILTPQDMTDSTGTALKLKEHARIDDKPILASWMGAGSIEEGDRILNQAGIPTFEYPDQACKAFAYMWNYTYNLKGIYETPVMQGPDSVGALEQNKEIEKIIEKAKGENRELLTEFESKQVLDLFQIPTVKTEIATDKNQAAEVAKKIGFPVVLKLHSETITHKTDVGGVKLNLLSEEAVQRAFDEIYESVKTKKGEEHFQGVTVQEMISLNGYEIILGSSIDQQFGPVLLFGTGGQLVEVYKDRALALPPLTSTLAKRLMARTKIFTALQGVRGKKAVDIEGLEKILVQFSNLIAQHPWIKECDINPLLVSEDRIVALDARIILHNAEEKNLPQLAIRPYPLQYIHQIKLSDGTPATIRPIRPEDVPLITKFHKDLSEKSVRQRYLKFIQYDERTAHDRLVSICFTDYDREIALVVEKNHNGKEILAVAKLTKLAGTNDARFAIIVKDDWQHKGLGKNLMDMIIKIAKKEHIETILAYMLPENDAMQKICQKNGFELTEDKSQQLILAQLRL